MSFAPYQKRDSSVKSNSAFNTSRKKSKISSLMDLHQTVGNQEMQRLLKSHVLQAQLKISHPNDPYEIEADHVAEQIMCISKPNISMNKQENKSVRKCNACEKEAEVKISRKPSSTSNLETSDNVSNRINSIQGGGSPLDQPSRDFMESRFGFDFSKVRIHDDSESGALAMSINAKAFTIGNDIFLGNNESEKDKKLLSHELTHVIQQTAIIHRIYDPPTGRTDPNAIIPIKDFIKYVKDVERANPGDSPSEIVSRMRIQYYDGIAFEQLIPDAHTADVVAGFDMPVIVKRTLGGISKDTRDHLTARADENAMGDNPSPYIQLEDGTKLDAGHLLLGLDALIHPRTSIPYTNYLVPNIDPASWVADLGIASVWMTYHEMNEKPHEDAPETSSLDANKYFEISAPIEDIIGDVDSFGLYANFAVSEGKTLSQILTEYYVTQPLVKHRWRLFCLSNNLIKDPNQKEWNSNARKDIIARVNLFADLYFAGEVGAILGVLTGPRTDEWKYTPTMVDKFLNIVKANLEREQAQN